MGSDVARREYYMRTRLFVATGALLVATLGCREDIEQPTAPQPEAALDVTPARTLAFRQVSAGGVGHTCGVTTDSVAYCWGGNEHGQLGNGTHTESLWPVRVRAGGLRFRPVTAGGDQTCAWPPATWPIVGDPMVSARSAMAPRRP